MFLASEKDSFLGRNFFLELFYEFFQFYLADVAFASLAAAYSVGGDFLSRMMVR